MLDSKCFYSTLG